MGYWNQHPIGKSRALAVEGPDVVEQHHKLQSSSSIAFIICHFPAWLAISFLVLSIAVAGSPWVAPIAIITVFIAPGAQLILAFSRSQDSNIVGLIKNGFFVSILLVVGTTALLMLAGLPRNPLEYAIAVLALVGPLSLWAELTHKRVELTKVDGLLVGTVFLAFVFLFLFFSSLPHLFTPDETSYVFSARWSDLAGLALPIGTRPTTSTFVAVISGRLTWTLLLASFLGSTSLPASQAGLIGTILLPMTALVGCSFFRSHRLRLVALVLILAQPSLFVFAGLALNDLFVAYLSVFSVLSFARALRKRGDVYELDRGMGMIAILSLLVLFTVKIDLLILVAEWFVIAYLYASKRLTFRSNLGRSIVKLLLLLPVIYELVIDLPYFVSVWILRNSALGSVFGTFLPVSPIETVASQFVAPWWNPGAKTAFSLDLPGFVSILYKLLSPESLSILVPAILLLLPFLLYKKKAMFNDDEYILALFISISLLLFFFVSFTSALDDIARYSTWMVPLWVVLVVIFVSRFVEAGDLYVPMFLLLPMVLLIWMNAFLSQVYDGIQVGYSPLGPTWSYDSLLLVSSVFIGLLLWTSQWKRTEEPRPANVSIRYHSKHITPGRLLSAGICVLILMNSLFYAPQFVANSSVYQEQGVTGQANTIASLVRPGAVVVANDYIQLRPYVDNMLLQSGSLIPLPSNQSDFIRLLGLLPNSSILALTNDSSISWYEYGNSYAGSYFGQEMILGPGNNKTGYQPLALSSRILYMNFSGERGNTIPDLSSFNNSGQNHGASVVNQSFGDALSLNGSQYVGIPNSVSLTATGNITIEFLANFEDLNPASGYMILSKGYAPVNGSYDVFLWNSKCYFELGGVGSLSFNFTAFEGNWHQYVFTYDGARMLAYVDGTEVGATYARGIIRQSQFPLDLGRDSERDAYYYKGQIGDLQISNEPLDIPSLATSYHSAFAELVPTRIQSKNYHYFVVVNRNVSCQSSLGLQNLNLFVSQNRTVNVVVRVTSSASQECALVISTDSFGQPFAVTLQKGPNLLNFSFPFITNFSGSESGGPYWLPLEQTQVIVMGSGQVSNSNVTTPQNPTIMTLVLLFLAIAVVSVFVVSGRKAER